MRLKISGGGRRIRLFLPNWMLMNWVTAAIAGQIIRRQRETCPRLPPLSGKDIRRVFRAARQAKRLLNGQPLVEVRAAGGDSVWISL